MPLFVFRFGETALLSFLQKRSVFSRGQSEQQIVIFVGTLVKGFKSKHVMMIFLRKFLCILLHAHPIAPCKHTFLQGKSTSQEILLASGTSILNAMKSEA
jgi:hypothetical protein